MNPLNSCSVDEFRMYYYKVIPCRKHYSHDWSDCPFAHAGEKACRRCPRTHMYTGLSCPDMKKNGECPRGDKCHFSHNSFEYWLHPSRYRSQFCTFGTNCRRPVCFFAHTIEELRMPNAPVKPGKGLGVAFPDLPDAVVPDMYMGDGASSPFDELMQAPGMFQQQLVPRNNMQQQYMDPMTCEVFNSNDVRSMPEQHYGYMGYSYSTAPPALPAVQKPQEMSMPFVTASSAGSEMEAMLLAERSSGSLDTMRPVPVAAHPLVRSPVNNPTLMVRRVPAPAPMTIGRSSAYCAGDMLPVQEQYNAMGWPMQAV